MALNITQEEIDISADEDTKKKIELEAFISAALLRGYFKPISKRAFEHYSEFGQFPNLDDFLVDLESVLSKRYSITAKKFIRQVRDELGNPENASDIASQINDISGVQQALDVFNSTKFISDTTHKDLRRSVDELIIAAATVGVSLSSEEVAKKAKKHFDDLAEARLPTISMTETQGAAEGAKYNEMNALLRNNAVFVGAGVNLAKAKTTKTWITKMDARVRPAHVLAEGQKKKFENPYVVDGELLKRPRDSSLGASPGNVINCRCASVVTIKRGKDVSRFSEIV